MNEIITQKLKDLPEKPGVYIMKSEKGEILYIGKARSLKNRVRQYFGSPKNKTTKVLIMVSKIYTFDYIITNNEIEALVLENNLIKKHKPPYNILLKDDKNYPFIRINMNEKFPKIQVVRKLAKDGAKYFGPYMQGISAKEIMELIHSAFKLRTCNINMDNPPKNHRPCLNNHIGRCLAPCVGAITQAEYMDIIGEVIKFLQGNDKSIERIIKEKMVAASEKEEFELAIYYRERLKVLEKLVRKQVTALPNDADLDIFAIASDGINTVVSMLFVRGGKLLGGDKQIINALSIDCAQTLESFVNSYYNGDNLLVNQILVNEEFEDFELVCDYLSQKKGSKVLVATPIMGVRKQLVDMAYANAKDFLAKCKNQEERTYNMTLGAVSQLQQILNLPIPPDRIECYDISNISGTDKVSSMVVFENGEKAGKMYRKFKIKTVEGSNDFASMKETLIRRFSHLNDEDMSFSSKPDLIVVDGGKGQLKYALQAMEESNVKFNIISLAEREEEIYLPHTSEPLVLSKDSQALRLLQRIRDEAHRFAITYHRNLRGKRQTKSELLQIEGVGESTIKKLFATFKTLSAIKNASKEEIAEIKGVSEKVATNIYQFYHTVID